jgi:hypothetical protein
MDDPTRTRQWHRHRLADARPTHEKALSLIYCMDAAGADILHDRLLSMASLGSERAALFCGAKQKRPKGLDQ